MKADRIKKIALVLLVAVALYIWWGNLKLLAPNNPTTERSSASYQKPVKATGMLIYRPPQVNPFVTVSSADLVPAVEASPVRPVPLEQTWRLVGLVKDKRSAAILKSQTATAVLQPADSLGGWVVGAVGENFVIVKKDIWRDTLWLWQEASR